MLESTPPPESRKRVGRGLIIGLVLLQVAGAAFLLLNRDRGWLGDGASERLTAEEAFSKGAEAQTKGDVETAEELYRQVLEEDPNNKVAYYNLGVLEEGKGPDSRAEEYYSKALAIDPNFVPALFNLAIRREAAGNPQEAADIYRKIIQLEPSMARARLNLGFVLLRKLGQKEEGKDELLKAIILDESLAKRVPIEELRS